MFDKIFSRDYWLRINWLWIGLYHFHINNSKGLKGRVWLGRGTEVPVISPSLPFPLSKPLFVTISKHCVWRSTWKPGSLFDTIWPSLPFKESWLHPWKDVQWTKEGLWNYFPCIITKFISKISFCSWLWPGHHGRCFIRSEWKRKCQTSV